MKEIEPHPLVNHTVQNETASEVDLSQLQRNLSLSPEDRLNEHQSALNLVLELRDAGQRLRDQSQ